MKKKMISIILCAAFAGLLFTGCGTGDTSKTIKAAALSAGDEKTDSGDKYELTVISHDPRTSATGEFLEAWAEAVREASGGRLNIVLFHNAAMAGVEESYDYVLEGKTDIAWGLQSAYTDEFPVTGVFSLPMLGIEDAVQGSEALWNFFNETDYMDEEYEPFHVLLLHTNCESPISTAKDRVSTVEELAALNIRANNGPATMFVEELGATPVAVPITNLYSAFMDGTCNAAITDWHAIRSFALNGACRYFLDEDMGVGTYFMVMNQDSYDSLPEDLQKILDETSTDAIKYTSIWNDYESEVRKLISDVDPRAVYSLNDEEEAKLQDIAERTAEKWIEEMNEKGYDGNAIYEKALEYIEAAK